MIIFKEIIEFAKKNPKFSNSAKFHTKQKG
jgi:hypothetical protein